jgi:hypothetical protein
MMPLRGSTLLTTYCRLPSAHYFFFAILRS